MDVPQAVPGKLPDFMVTQVAARSTTSRETVRKYLKTPERMHAATRARIQIAMVELGLIRVEG